MTEKRVKKYALSGEEKDRMIKLKHIFDNLDLEMNGIMRLMDIVLVECRVRVGISDDKPPEGIQRNITFDPKTFELVIIDEPIIRQREEAGK